MSSQKKKKVKKLIDLLNPSHQMMDQNKEWGDVTRNATQTK